ncbi:capsid cement protein [Sphingomonas sp. SRS2]|uniref:capsid cement protein n=1 Tax=Sphingomonas sp. SRS2 TaxID=133190 RepID=UPI000618490C|nr:capsid cement protein [Sphingomonas sp. SRS2]KKC27435.1 hypothetical protein WP12_03405 [Sphingomonas sp. SRS2]
MTGTSAQGTKGFKAGGAIGARLFIKFGSADDSVVQGAAATDLLIGVSTDISADSGEPVDVHTDGIREIIYGGNVTRGAKLTSDASGKAITAAPAQGVNNQIGGIAMVSGVSGDIGLVKIAPSTMQGA